MRMRRNPHLLAFLYKVTAGRCAAKAGLSEETLIDSGYADACGQIKSVLPRDIVFWESEIKMEDRFRVGIISSTHGIAGEVKVYPTTDDPKRFRKLKEVILDTGKETQILHVEQARFFKQMVILKFKEFQNINDVEMLRGKSLYVTRENAVKLKKDEYFIADMIGMHVSSDEGEDLGELYDVLKTAANDVYVVKKEGCEELLVPAIRDCVLSVDTEAGEMVLHLLPGLR